MKHILILTTTTLLDLITSPLYSQQDRFIKDYVEHLENSKKYLLHIAEMMPENKYSFKATPESLRFSEHLMHIGFALDWHSQSLLGNQKARDWETDTVFKVTNTSKKEMLTTIDKTFMNAIQLIKEFNTSQFDDTLDYFGLKRTKRQIFLLLADHITHHRGQILVYIRLNKLAPPRYVLYQ